MPRDEKASKRLRIDRLDLLAHPRQRPAADLTQNIFIAPFTSAFARAEFAVDVRRGSPTFGRHVGVRLSEENGRQFFVPRGFAHGFQVVSETADIMYKCDNLYSPADELVVRWNDPALAIEWPIADPILSARDAQAPLLADVKGLPQAAE